MNATAQNLLERFDALSRDDQREVAREILRRTAEFESAPLSDEDLTQNADELFLELDRAEAANADQSRPR
jgi:hypothetical protein